MTDWQPTATIDVLRQRAAINHTIREFFQQRDVLEVEAPLLARYSVTDPHMDVLTADNPCGLEPRYFLQTSPEYAMKRLLAAGSGAIYQLGKAFRRGEKGSRHNPEFTMLEWYCPGFNHHQLMAEVAELVTQVLACGECAFLSYREMFQQALAIDPHCCSLDELQRLAHQHVEIVMDSVDKDDWLNLLLAEVIEPTLGNDMPCFVYDYPVSQAALAKIAEDDLGVPVAQRFELYYKGIELANGYHELTDAKEQAQRFQQDNQQRVLAEKGEREGDLRLLAAMEHGLPECAGVALGVDRLVMLATGCERIDEVLAFGVDRA